MKGIHNANGYSFEQMSVVTVFGKSTKKMKGTHNGAVIGLVGGAVVTVFSKSTKN